VGWLALGVLVAAVPWLVAAAVPRQQRYVLHVLIFTALFAALALSYDLVVGHVGSLSLAHPAFFGVGAYTAAILATTAGWPFVADVAAAVVAAALVAGLVGVPLFRLAEHAFAVGTLGLGLVASVVANNWVEVTRGPLCITGIPKPKLEDYLANCDQQTLDLVASFQRALVEDLVGKTLAAARAYDVATLFVTGGVAANNELRRTFEQSGAQDGLPVYFPSRPLSTDNAAMIAAAAYPNFLAKDFAALDFSAEASLVLR